MPVLSDEELARLLAACRGATFENRRDEAIVRLFVDSGIRADLIGITVDGDPSPGGSAG